MSRMPTRKQNWYLNLASAKPVTTSKLLKGRQLVDPSESIDACYGTLHRMEKRGWIWLDALGLWRTTVQGDGIRSRGSNTERQPE